MEKKLPWAKIWDDFETWHQKTEEAQRCDSCYHVKKDRAEWPDQMKAIARIVEKYRLSKSDRTSRGSGQKYTQVY